jgi:hypothetical protein
LRRTVVAAPNAPATVNVMARLPDPIRRLWERSMADVVIGLFIVGFAVALAVPVVVVWVVTDVSAGTLIVAWLGLLLVAVIVVAALSLRGSRYTL